MDDPWGSPWATPDTEKDTGPPSPAKSSRSDLEPPPRAFFSASPSPKIPTLSGPSPWADEDDGFGDWAAPPDTSVPTQSGWGGGWAAPSPKIAIPVEESGFGQATPISWPGSIALPKTASISSLRQSSLDPWSADFSPPIDDSTTPRLIVDAPPTPTELKAPDDLQTEESGWGMEDALPREVAGHEETPTQMPVEDEGKSTPPVPSSGAEPHALDHELDLVSAKPATHVELSPPSSNSGDGDDTDQEEGRQDSPITSIDEDARARQPIVRTVSSKVQELVVKFDGLARAASEEPPTIKPQRSKSSLRPHDNGDPDGTSEFGDFEGGIQDQDNEPPETERPQTSEGTATLETPMSPGAATRIPLSVASPPVASPQDSRDVSRIGDRGAAALNAAKFDVDLAAIDSLFTKLEGNQPAEIGSISSDVPDYVLSDNFTEITERKTWYRISRLGSSRRYNTGDDDNYKLVTWPVSTTRQDTLKIVRRWMEEDSIAGRVTLGGGVAKTQKNMFGWDSSVEPVALDSVFGRKKHTRGSSTHTLHDAQRKPSGTSHRPASVVVPPVATFGWSTNSPTFSQTQSPSFIKSPTEPTSTAVKPVVPPPQKPIVSVKPALPASPAQPAPPLAQAPSAPVPQSFSADDEDEWGEMVSSPFESKPAVGGLLSFDDAFAIPSSSSVIASHPPATKAPTPHNMVSPPSSSDPWAAVDFSVFESPSKPTSVPPAPSATPMFKAEVVSPPATVDTLPTPKTSFEPAQLSLGLSTGLMPPASTSRKQIASDDGFIPTTPLEIRSPVSLATADDDLEDDAIQQILANLPDLSYMLR